jgi:RimJ/RimL family protein N-acetyltransferase
VIPAPDPPLSDGVVTLRQWEPSDVPALVECLDGDPEITRWLELVPQPYDESEARTWVQQAASYWHEGTAAPFAVTDAGSGEVVGGVGFRWVDLTQAIGEVGYWLGRDARGRGLTTRAVHLLSKWALDTLDCERLQLRADELNVPSQRVAEKVGFRREGVLRSQQFSVREGRRVDFVMYSLLPGELSDLPG